MFRLFRGETGQSSVTKFVRGLENFGESWDGEKFKNWDIE